MKEGRGNGHNGGCRGEERGNGRNGGCRGVGLVFPMCELFV